MMLRFLLSWTAQEAAISMYLDEDKHTAIVTNAHVKNGLFHTGVLREKSRIETSLFSGLLFIFVETK